MPDRALIKAHGYLRRNRQRVAAAPSLSSTGRTPVVGPRAHCLVLAFSCDQRRFCPDAHPEPPHTSASASPWTKAHPAVLMPCPAGDRSLGQLSRKHPILPGQVPLPAQRRGIAQRPDKTGPSGCGLEVVGNVIACGPSPATPGSSSESWGSVSPQGHWQPERVWGSKSPRCCWSVQSSQFFPGLFSL